jgi:hypothetical protein
MAVMVPKVVEYLEWAGMEVNVPKSPITAMDMKTGKRVATDSITLHGVPFPVIPPSQSHKHLGLLGQEGTREPGEAAEVGSPGGG